MIGAIIGDIVGSRFEWHNIKSKDFDFFTNECKPTDDSIMTMAVAKALCICKEDYSDLNEKAISCMQEFGRKKLNCGFGKFFKNWILSDNPMPYGSFGNGAGMRISPVAFVAKDIDECKKLSKIITEVTHNSHDGIIGGESIAVCGWMARNNYTKDEIAKYVSENYYDLNFKLDDIRDNYRFTSSCKKSVPQAIEAFLEGNSFEDIIRCAISIGGDSDTIACMAGGIAEAFYGVPDEYYQYAEKLCDPEMFKYVKILKG